MRAAILQPSYLPWLGFFEQMYVCDIFVYLDDVQYTKNDWRNRNKIKNDFRMFIESRKDFSFGVDQDFLKCIWEDYQSDYYGFTITTKNLPDVNGKIGTYTKKYKKMIK